MDQTFDELNDLRMLIRKKSEEVAEIKQKLEKEIDALESGSTEREAAIQNIRNVLATLS
jgi:hypothetical protein